MKPVSVDRAKCQVCGLCVEECGREGLALEGGEIVLGGVRCMECGHCVAVCPNGALATEEGVPAEIDGGLRPSPEQVDLLLRARRSHRHYGKREVEDEVVERLIEAARHSPSGKNEQPFEFVVLHSPEARRAFTEACYACMKRGQRKMNNPFWRWVVGALVDPRVHDPNVRRSLSRALRRREMDMDPLFFNAPLILVVHAPILGSTPKDDCCYALFHAVLMAESLGLGSCINGNSVVLARHFPELIDHLGIPRDHRIYACATFGYPRTEYVRLVHRRPAKARWL